MSAPDGGGLPAWIWPTATMAGMILLWQGTLAVIPVPAWLLPSPASIVVATWAWYPHLPGHTVATLGATLAGYGLAIAVGVPAAVMIVASPFLEQTLYPILLVFQSVPKVAVAPILLVWVGYGQLPKVLAPRIARRLASGPF